MQFFSSPKPTSNTLYSASYAMATIANNLLFNAHETDAAVVFVDAMPDFTDNPCFKAELLNQSATDVYSSFMLNCEFAIHQGVIESSLANYCLSQGVLITHDFMGYTCGSFENIQTVSLAQDMFGHDICDFSSNMTSNIAPCVDEFMTSNDVAEFLKSDSNDRIGPTVYAGAGLALLTLGCLGIFAYSKCRRPAEPESQPLLANENANRLL